MVFVPVCDDVIPGHLMAAARLDLPAVVVTGGYMRLNRWDGAAVDPLDVAGGHLVDRQEGGRAPPTSPRSAIAAVRAAAPAP